jgi:hypothetical protein
MLLLLLIVVPLIVLLLLNAAAVLLLLLLIVLLLLPLLLLLLYQVSGVVIATVGFVIAVQSFDVELADVSASHGKIGVAVLCALYSQVRLGLNHSTKAKTTKPQPIKFAI